MNYEEEVKKNSKRNEKFLKGFEAWLNDKHLTEETINRHIDNTDFFINLYLNYYDIIRVEAGYCEVVDYLGDFFIRKCMWATKSTIKETAASLKKFYCYMCENGYIDNEDYKYLCEDIRQSMDIVFKNFESFMNGSFEQFSG